MNLVKTKELLSLTPLTGDKALDKDMKDAFNLGIEAIKAVQKAREGDYASFKFPLPGETPKSDSPQRFIDAFDHAPSSLKKGD